MFFVDAALEVGGAVRVAVLFPGQGSQYPGMADPWLAHPAGRETLRQVSDVWGTDAVELCRDEGSLATTELVQPALFACDIAAFRVVLERGRAMQAASVATPGAMTALIGLSPEDAAEVCQVAGRGDVLEVANENAPRQIVLSGSVAAIERAEDAARTKGAKAIRLRVAGAFHSPLMRPALERVREAISHLEFREPRMSVVPNASGRSTREPSVLRDLLSRHLVSPVRWERSMRALGDAGCRVFVEAGPGDVLSKLVRRTVRGSTAIPVGSPDQARSAARSLSDAELQGA